MHRQVLRTIPLFGLLLSTGSNAQPVAPANADAIVITAQRSGIPVWRVRGPAGTLVLVGTSEDVAKGTNWNPESLANALRGADQVMFPQDAQLTGGFLAMLRAPGKVRRMQRLPAGETLARYVTPLQFRRLVGLQERGLLKSGFERQRPLFVAYDLIEAAKGEPASGGFLSISRVDWKTDPKAFVRTSISRFRLRLVPMRKQSLNSALDNVATIPPAAQVPCLLAAADAADAGAQSFRARSQAWVRRQVPAVLNSPAERAFAICGSVVRTGPTPQELETTLVGVVQQPLVTLAVVDLSQLGGADRILDHLAARGYELSGPAWK